MKKIKHLIKDDAGMGVIEVILIIVVLIAMVVIFRDQITDLVENIWKSINRSVSGLI